MPLVERSDRNPLLWPNRANAWENEAAFNGCVIKDDGVYRMVYRAESAPVRIGEAELHLSSVGIATSRNGLSFSARRQLIAPEHDWERYGCEDPRITKLGKKYYVFYTALSRHPFGPDGIRVGVAVTKDLKTLEKHPVTTFNAKAMALFPKKVGGKYVAVLTANTDRPPSTVGIAMFDNEEDIWSPKYWDRWYRDLAKNALALQRSPNDHIEVGAPPVLTKDGWLLIYSYIRNYKGGGQRIFGVEAALLDLNDPRKILMRTARPVFVPEEQYELYGRVPNIVFPSGAVIEKGTLRIYYGAADTTCCVATCKVDALLDEMRSAAMNLQRCPDNPIIEPDPAHPWEAKATFNPGVVQAGGKVHILYRAMSHNDVSVIGYASSKDGAHPDERLPDPVYVPREQFEKSAVGGASGCEDPRLTRIGDRVFMCYTAYDGVQPRIALTSIALSDLVARRWNWTAPTLISPPDVDDKDAAIFPKKFGRKYAILHRLGTSVWIDFVDDLDFHGTRWLGGHVLLKPRTGLWDSRKIGIGGPPIETKQGWLLLYHGISKREDRHYHVRAALLDLKDPRKVIARTRYPIFEPEERYEREGLVNNVVFPCGSAVIRGRLFVYYGGADKVVGVGCVDLAVLLKRLMMERS